MLSSNVAQKSEKQPLQLFVLSCEYCDHVLALQTWLLLMPQPYSTVPAASTRSIGVETSCAPPREGES